MPYELRLATISARRPFDPLNAWYIDGRAMRRFSCVLVSLSALVACAKTSGNTAPNLTIDDCNDLIDALATAYVRCGHDANDPNTSRQALLDSAVNGNCALVTSIRDHGSLQNVCLGSLTTIECNELESHDLDDSCKLQLITPTSPQ